MKIIQVLITAVIVLGYQTLNAQQVVLSATQNTQSETGSLSASIGQIVYKQHSSSSIVLLEGVQQPLEVVLQSTSLAPGINYELKAYPNPSSAYVCLSLSSADAILNYTLYSLDGQLLKQGQVQTPETYISVQDLPPANYILQVAGEGGFKQVFEIIKQP